MALTLEGRVWIPPPYALLPITKKVIPPLRALCGNPVPVSCLKKIIIRTQDEKNLGLLKIKHKLGPLGLSDIRPPSKKTYGSTYMESLGIFNYQGINLNIWQLLCFHL